MAPGKKGKKKELSEEQKQRIADQKALAEKEKLVRRHQLTVAFLKLKKEKEFRLLKLNDNTLLDLWRPRLRKLKIQELLKDFEAKRMSFEVAYEKKKQLIEELENVIKFNNQEYDNTFDSHLHSMDKMLDFYRNRLKDLEKKHSSNRKGFLDKHMEEMQHVQVQQEKNLQHLHSIKDAVEIRRTEIACDSRKDFEIREDQIQNKFLQSGLELTEEVDKKIKHIWLQINDIFTSYHAKIKPTVNNYSLLYKQDQTISLQIDRDYTNICALKKGVRRMDNKLNLVPKVYNNLMKSLESKKKEYQQNCNRLDCRHKTYKQTGVNAIHHFALTSHDVLEHMNSLIVQRNRTQKIIERCIRFENFQIDPQLTKSALHDLIKGDKTIVDIKSSEVIKLELDEIENPENVMALISPASLCKECGIVFCKCEKNIGKYQFKELVEDPSLMEKFWTRFNRVCLEKAAYELRKERLKNDNYQLRHVLRNYMSGMNPKCHTQEIFKLNQMETIPSFLISSLSGSSDSLLYLQQFDDDVETISPSLYALPSLSNDKTKSAQMANAKNVAKTMSRGGKPRMKSSFASTDRMKGPLNSHLVGMNIIEGAHVVQRWEKFGNLIPDIGISTVVV